MPDKSRWSCIDLFAGAGGMSEGFQQAGFDVLAGNDFDRYAGLTFQANHPDAVFIPGPIHDLTPRDFMHAAGLGKGELDCLIGGPPCQGFSVYNHQRGMDDKRSGLFREYLRLVEGLRPATLIMENVTGITSIADGRVVKEIYRQLEHMGYTVDHRILKAEEYGVPQERRRIFFAASRIGPIVWPTPSHGPQSRCKTPFVTVEDAIGDLPPVEILGGTEVATYGGTVAETAYQRAMRRGSRRLTNHVGPHLAEINRSRLKHIPPGGSWRDIPHRLLPAGMKLARRCDHTKRYGRLHPEGLASTILTKCDLHWGAYIHPSQERTLTVREAARFQSFPDRVFFHGARGEQFRQVGNAVPPRLGRAMALQVAALLEQRVSRPARRAPLFVDDDHDQTVAC